MNRRMFLMGGSAIVAGATFGSVQPRLGNVFSAPPQPAVKFRVDDPGREMLGFILSRPGREGRLADHLSLGAAKVLDLRRIWQGEQLEPRRLLAENAEVNPQAVDRFNSAAAVSRRASHESFRSLLTSAEYTEALKVLEAWWLEDYQRKASSAPSIFHTARATHSSCYSMLATQYAPTTSGSVEVAMPDKYIKFINRGWYGLLPPFGYPAWLDTRATVTWGSTTRTTQVNEVGPWNEDDNWWDSSPASDGCRGRRMFGSLPRCYGEAWKAFFDGYNGGNDQFGRHVLNGGEIDLSLAFAASLGLAYLQNDYVNVVPLWHGC